MKNIKNLDDRVLFDQKCTQEIKTQALDTEFQDISYKWINKAASHNYSYHFKWLGVPIIQHPSDIIIMQELIFNIKPDLIIETGIARGGSLIFYSSMLELIWKDDKNPSSEGIRILAERISFLIWAKTVETQSQKIIETKNVIVFVERTFVDDFNGKE